MRASPSGGSAAASLRSRVVAALVEKPLEEVALERELADLPHGVVMLPPRGLLRPLPLALRPGLAEHVGGPTSWSRHSHAGDGATPRSPATCDSILLPLATSSATAILNSGPYALLVDFDTLDPSLSGPRCLSAHRRGIRTESQTVSKNRQPHYFRAAILEALEGVAAPPWDAMRALSVSLINVHNP